MNISVYAVPGLYISREVVETTACKVCQIERADLYKATRETENVWARQLVHWYLFEQMHMKDRKVCEGTPIHRTTVLHSVRKVNERLEVNDKKFTTIWREFMRGLGRSVEE